jgi:hypothetical protein
MAKSIHHEDEVLVERTTPQGTQESGVDKGYEKRDIWVRELVIWFGGLAIGIAVTTVLCVFGVMWLISNEKPTKSKLSTPLFGRNLPVRTPELLPNPQQLEPGGKGFTLPWDHAKSFETIEREKAGQFGFADKDGRASLPAGLVGEVARESRPDAKKWQDEVRWSEASGGVGEEVAILTR